MVESWQPRLFKQSPPDNGWTHNHHYLYSLLWSAFLDLDAFTASRLRKRFFPYSTNFVVRELLFDEYAHVELHVPGEPSRLRATPSTRLDDRFRDVALWTTIPKLLGPPPYRDRRAPVRNEHGLDDAEVAQALGAIVSEHFKNTYDLEQASFRLDPESRPIVPPALGLSIADARFDVTAGRRVARARLSAVVQSPFRQDEMAQLSDPQNWTLFGFWDPGPNVEARQQHDGIPMRLLLPGGNQLEPSKWRELSFSYASAITPFESRIDYEAVERRDPAALVLKEAITDAIRYEADRASNGSDESPDARSDKRWQWGKDFPHIGHLRGYLSLEKVQGRPGWTRFTAEREARFESPNHDRFRVETLMFWLTCELVSFAIQFARVGPAEKAGIP